MATTVVDLGEYNDKLEFSGSSEEDVAYAKTFWQSVQLFPPMESRLVSSDIKQRLKTAPPGWQPVNITYPPREEPSKLKAFLAQAHLEQRAGEMARHAKLAELRERDRHLLHKHRQQRMEKEIISKKVNKASEPTIDIQSDEEGDEEEINECLREIEKFEAQQQAKMSLGKMTSTSSGGFSGRSENMVTGLLEHVTHDSAMSGKEGEVVENSANPVENSTKLVESSSELTENAIDIQGRNDVAGTHGQKEDSGTNMATVGSDTESREQTGDEQTGDEQTGDDFAATSADEEKYISPRIRSELETEKDKNETDLEEIKALASNEQEMKELQL